VHVVEAGGVLQHVAYGDCRRLAKRVVDDDVGEQVGNLRVEVELAVLVELDQCHGDEALADRAGTKMGVGGHRHPAVAIGPADATGPLGAIDGDQRQPGAGHAGLLEYPGSGGLELLDSLRCRVNGDGQRLPSRQRHGGDDDGAGDDPRAHRVILAAGSFP
jgi:hypothetical protein